MKNFEQVVNLSTSSEKKGTSANTIWFHTIALSTIFRFHRHFCFCTGTYVCFDFPAPLCLVRHRFCSFITLFIISQTGNLRSVCLFLRPKGKKPPSSSACIPPSMIHYRVESDYSLSVLLSSIVCLLLARSVHLEGTKKARGFTILVDWNPTLEQKLFMVGSFLVPIAYRPVLKMTCCAIIVAGWSVATSLPLCSVRYELQVLPCFRFYLTTWRRTDRCSFRNKRMTDGPCHSLEFRASARWRLSVKRPNPESQRCNDASSFLVVLSFYLSFCLVALFLQTLTINRFSYTMMSIQFYLTRNYDDEICFSDRSIPFFLLRLCQRRRRVPRGFLLRPCHNNFSFF